MECVALYDVEDIIAILPVKQKMTRDIAYKEFDGVKVDIYKDRYITFATKGTTCEKCGLEGEFFALEKQDGCDVGVLNLIGVDDNDREIVISVTTNRRKGKIPVGTVLCSECQHKYVSHSRSIDNLRR